MVATWLMDWDHAGLMLAHGTRVPWLDSVFMTLTWLGSLAVLLPVAALVWWRRRSNSASFVLLALVSSSALVHLVKLIVARPRPELFPPLIAMPVDASFPSAHAMQATAFALAWLMQPGKSPGRVETGILFITVILVCFSRLYLQVHYPSDIIVGAVLAVLWVLFLRQRFHETRTSNET